MKDSIQKMVLLSLHTVFRFQGFWVKTSFLMNSCLTFTACTHDLGASHHHLLKVGSLHHIKMLTYSWLENWLRVAETGPIWDSRSRSSPSLWGFWEPQTTFLMNQNTKEITLRTVVIYCPTPCREQPVEFAAMQSRAEGSTRPRDNNQEAYLASTSPPRAFFFSSAILRPSWLNPPSAWQD